MKSNLEIKKIIDITIKWILKTKSHLDSEKVKRPKQNGYKDDLDIWNKIAFEYFGKIENKNALNIFSWCKRNTHKFPTIVKSKISKFDDSFMEVENVTEQEIVLDLDQKDLEVIKKFIRFYEPRSKFNTDFANFLSERLQNFGIKCWLRTTGNAFKKKLSQKKSSPFTKVTVKEEYFHENFLKAKIRSAGIERINQSINVLAHGILNVSINNRINNDENTNFLDQKVTNRFTLAMCKSSLVNFYKISNDAFVDALATKNLCDHFLTENECGMNGYIQEISLSPFGYLLFSKIQVYINLFLKFLKA
ncbi:unnamed protein product [Brachionus calyciflorus]|uniref:Uncharacterized protein n=1 Tax=Brachionus calyciflorus TaxID=104777 RepID=A0A814MLY0_9BILA|nr:unnamed protein product [Brachionus calyciflorus]